MKRRVFLYVILIFTVSSLQGQVDSIQFPVSLYSFEAGVLNNSTKLRWKTECYISYANFQIQKSLNGTAFFTIKSFTADRLRCQQPFILVDSAESDAEIIFYRINAGDIDGHFFHSKIIRVSHKQTGVEIVSVYPTFISSDATIVLSSSYDSHINLQLVSANGVLIRRYNYGLKKGVSSFNLNFGYVSKGAYWIKLADVKGKQQSIAVVKL